MFENDKNFMYAVYFAIIASFAIGSMPALVSSSMVALAVGSISCASTFIIMAILIMLDKG
jgi:hypothetical protein